MSSATDNFNRGVQTDLGANWTSQIGTLRTNVSNACEGADGGGYNASFYNAASFGNNQYSQAIIASSGAYHGISVRASGTELATTRTAYYALLGNAQSRISKVVNNTITDLTPSNGLFPDPGLNVLVKLEVVGSVIRLFYDGVQQYEDISDSSITSGSPGVILFANATQVDNWEGGDQAMLDPGLRLGYFGKRRRAGHQAASPGTFF